MNFWNWLFSDAGAGWFAAILAIIGLIISWLQRNRPSRIIVQEISSIKFLDVRPGFDDKLHITFESKGQAKEIKGLQTNIFAVYNNGNRDISEPIHLTLEIQNKPKFVEQASDTLECKVVPNINKVKIELPFLNSYSVHKHYARFALITDDELQFTVIQGNGKGWSSKFISLKAEKAFRKKFGGSIIYSLLGLGVVEGIIIFANYLLFKTISILLGIGLYTVLILYMAILPRLETPFFLQFLGSLPSERFQSKNES